jgi:hypothetical protein
VDECGRLVRAGCRTTKSRRSRSESAEQSSATGLPVGLHMEAIEKNIEYLKILLDKHDEDYREHLSRGGVVRAIGERRVQASVLKNKKDIDCGYWLDHRRDCQHAEGKRKDRPYYTEPAVYEHGARLGFLLRAYSYQGVEIF